MDKLSIKELSPNGAYIICPNSYKDKRGSFSRVFCKEELSKIINIPFVQINHSITNKKGTVRGLHFQYEPDTEIKMIKCIRGSVLDIIIDIREGSSTFLECHYETLSETNMKMIYVPKGFAHGFQTLENNSELLYFHSEIYKPTNEGGLNIMDPLLNIKLPIDIMEISDKDKKLNYIDKNFKGIKIEL